MVGRKPSPANRRRAGSFSQAAMVPRAGAFARRAATASSTRRVATSRRRALSVHVHVVDLSARVPQIAPVAVLESRHEITQHRVFVAHRPDRDEQDRAVTIELRPQEPLVALFQWLDGREAERVVRVVEPHELRRELGGRGELGVERSPDLDHALPGPAALLRAPHHRRVRAALERLAKLRQVRERTDDAVLRDRVGIALDHQLLLRLGADRVAAELAPRDEELLLGRESVDRPAARGFRCSDC